jgi:hypothetical protein
MNYRANAITYMYVKTLTVGAESAQLSMAT